MSFVLGIDVEDWAQSTLDPTLPIFDRAKLNTRRMLELTEDTGVKATWFILGLFAEKFPEVVREIQEAGHEIACHGYSHLNVFEQSRAEFRSDVTSSKALLEDIIGAPVTGYRAPFFSLAPAGTWPLDVLAEVGFDYDSSVFPSAIYRNGVEGIVEGPTRIQLDSGSEIVELPPATLYRFGRLWPVAGGGYFRLLPRSMVQWVVDQAIRENGIFVSYFHPYEIDPDEFSNIPVATTLKTRLHQGLGRRSFESKIRRVLNGRTAILARDAAKSVSVCRKLPTS